MVEEVFNCFSARLRVVGHTNSKRGEEAGFWAGVCSLTRVEAFAVVAVYIPQPNTQKGQRGVDLRGDGGRETDLEYCGNGWQDSE